MSAPKRFRVFLLLFLSISLQPLQAIAQSSTASKRDEQHDFDFNLGTWKIHLSRLLHPLSGSTTWNEYEGVSVVRKVWNGRANLLELRADGPAGHIEGVGLRLYNPQSHQWSLNWANSNEGTLNQPMIGEFKNGRGEFFDQEPFNDRAIYVRNGFSDITPDSCRFEQAFSDDGGKTWETNWVMTFTRVKDESAPDFAAYQGGDSTTGIRPTKSGAAKAGSQQAVKERDGRHDFDFHLGNWKTHLWRLQRPLTGSKSWVEYDGTTTVRKVWNGRANLGELDVTGPTGRIEGLSLRLYNPESRQWSLNFANSASGTMSPPTIGESKNGRGEFVSQETLNGRAILVRFIISDITSDSCRFEQAFSDDGGKTWEANWIAIDTRVKNESDKEH
jgi:BNR/Asp-box repeat